MKTVCYLLFVNDRCIIVFEEAFKLDDESVDANEPGVSIVLLDNSGGLLVASSLRNDVSGALSVGSINSLASFSRSTS